MLLMKFLYYFLLPEINIIFLWGGGGGGGGARVAVEVGGSVAGVTNFTKVQSVFCHYFLDKIRLEISCEST